VANSIVSYHHQLPARFEHAGDATPGIYVGEAIVPVLARKQAERWISDDRVERLRGKLRKDAVRVTANEFHVD
jgi:hypothetical protein